MFRKGFFGLKSTQFKTYPNGFIMAALETECAPKGQRTGTKNQSESHSKVLKLFKLDV